MKENKNTSETDVRKYLINYIETHVNLASLSKHLKQLKCFDIVDNWCSEKINSYSFGHKLYWFVNNIHDFPKCKICGSDITKDYKSYAHGCRTQKNYCSYKCSVTKEVLEKRRATNLKKYGSEWSCRSKDVIDKMKSTFIEKYGVDNPMKCEQIKQKTIRTNNLKYGGNAPANSNVVKEKMKQTNLDRYGVEYTFQSEDVKEKIKSTNLKKYGVENVMFNEDIKTKLFNTNIEKYGVKSTLLDVKTQEKIKQTNLDRYGVDNPFKLKKVQERANIIHKTKCYTHFQHNENFEPIFTLEEYLANNDYNIKLSKWKCKKCGGTNVKFNNSSTYDNYRLRCYDCNPLLSGISHQEKELVEYIKSIYKGEIMENSRSVISPYELDIYLPNLNLAIEYNGEFWHYSENIKPNDYHQMKYDLCEEMGIKLIFIRERNWVNRNNDVKEFLNNIILVDSNNIL